MALTPHFIVLFLQLRARGADPRPTPPSTAGQAPTSPSGGTEQSVPALAVCPGSTAQLCQGGAPHQTGHLLRGSELLQLHQGSCWRALGGWGCPSETLQLGAGAAAGPKGSSQEGTWCQSTSGMDCIDPSRPGAARRRQGMGCRGCQACLESPGAKRSLELPGWIFPCGPEPLQTRSRCPLRPQEAGAMPSPFPVLSRRPLLLLTVSRRPCVPRVSLSGGAG